MSEKMKGLTGFQLKMIGIVFMVSDHIFEMFHYMNPPVILTMAGRMVFPIFLFLSAEGFYYTRNKKRYMGRLLVGFWLMSIGNLLIQQLFPMENVILINNVFGSLFLATVCMYAVDCLKEKRWLLGIGLFILPALPIFLFPIIGTNLALIRVIMFIPSYLVAEGGFTGVLLGVLFYIFRENRPMQFVSLAALSLLATGFTFTGLFSTNFQWMMVFAIVPLFFYNGQKGRGSKYFFYIFYPAHIYLLYILSYMYSHFS